MTLMMSGAIGRAQRSDCAAPELTVGVGGTATNLIAIRDHLDPYDPQRVHLNTFRLTVLQMKFLPPAKR